MSVLTVNELPVSVENTALFTPSVERRRLDAFRLLPRIEEKSADPAKSVDIEMVDIVRIRPFMLEV